MIRTLQTLLLFAALTLTATACNNKEPAPREEEPVAEQPGAEVPGAEEEAPPIEGGAPGAADPQAQVCQAAGAAYEEFPNGCRDTCEYARNPGLMCTQALTSGCDCGPDQCWNGTSCEPN